MVDLSLRSVCFCEDRTKILVMIVVIEIILLNFF